MFKYNVGDVLWTPNPNGYNGGEAGFDVKVLDRVEDGGKNYYTCIPVEFECFSRDIEESKLYMIHPSK